MRRLLITTALPVFLFSTPALAAEDIDQLKRDLAATQAIVKKLEARLNAVEKEKAAPTKQVAVAASAAPAPAPMPTMPARKSSSSAFNPSISAVLMGGFNAYSNNPEGSKISGFAMGEEAGLPNRGFSLGESEVTIASNIDDMFYGAVTASLNASGGETEIELEEAFIETLALPYGAKLRAGRFFPVLGYMNEIHAHADSFIDRPLPYRAFLGGSNFTDNGAQMSFMLPTGIYSEVGGGAFYGSAFPASDHGSGVSAQTAFARIGGDIGIESAWVAGLSHLRAKATERETDDVAFNGTTNTSIAHAKYTWAPGGNPANESLTLQGEYFWRGENGDYNAIDYDRGSSGWYAQGVYKFDPKWSAGYRYAQLDAAGVEAGLEGTSLDSMGNNPSAHSALLKYDNSEFSSIRLQYTRDEADAKPNNTLMLWYTVSMGAHGAHKY